ncbi:MAG: hypothetical protein LJE69_12250 [Thiohalocapsa sp.]|jgi:hypothetical protein|uniref:hypothetical protein n=1 Tax=Thiohalocapsa sp. TaxID=2497641 RepID=UPI0025E4BBC2|nr:hypothetical protein [Thiohalocapsa sp.]MCG6942008.1 hypothetical protein [Thiohalocapsa sp.]
MVTSPSCIYGESKRDGTGQRDCSPRWRERLPPLWHGRVVEPRRFRVHREHEMPARQAFGYDDAGRRCFHAYDYRLIEPRLDDDAGLCAALVYAESLRAWRLHDGRWLVSLRQWPDGDEGELIEIMTLMNHMPGQGIGQG